MEVKEAGEERNKGGQDDEKDGGWRRRPGRKETKEGGRDLKKEGVKADEQTGERSGHKAATGLSEVAPVCWILSKKTNIRSFSF